MDLATREAGPQPRREDFGPIEDYLLAWHTWRAIRRDCSLPAEAVDQKTRLLAQKLGVPSSYVDEILARP